MNTGANGVQQIEMQLIRRLTRQRPRQIPAAEFPGDWTTTCLYLGNLLPDETQFRNPSFIGLCLTAQHDREYVQDLYEPLPIPDGCIPKVQAQDVLEHLDFEKLPRVLDEVYRVLMPGGVFRLSVPDYRSPVQRRRSVFDEHGQVLADVMLGGHVQYDQSKDERIVTFDPGGDAHVWFPTIETVRELIAASALSACSEVREYQYFAGETEYVCEPIPDEEMVVTRSVPLDDRAQGRPVSIVVDCIK